MKQLICFLAIIILVQATVYCQIIEKHPLEISLKTNHQDLQKKSGQQKFSIIITNTADTSFSFYMMSCSWQDGIVFSPNTVYRVINGCDRNVSEIVRIEPQKNIVYTGDFSCVDSLKRKAFKLKVALKILSDKNSVFDFKDITDEQERKAFSEWKSKLIYDYIWSKPVFIKCN